MSEPASSPGHSVELAEAVDRALAHELFRSAPTCRRLVAILAAEQEAGRAVHQEDLAVLLHEDPDAKRRARGAARELRRRLERLVAETSGPALALASGEYRLHVVRPSTSPGGTEADRAGTSRARRRSTTRRVAAWLVGTLSLGALLLVALGVRVAARPRPARATRDVISSVSFGPDSFSGLNVLGGTLFSLPLPKGASRETHGSDERLFRAADVGDLHGDGTPLLVILEPRHSWGVVAPLLVLDQEGHEQLRKPMYEVAPPLAREAGVDDVVVRVLSPERTGLDEALIVVLARATGRARSVASVLDAQGERLASFSFAGTLDWIETWDADGNGLAELVLAGTHASLDRAAVLFLDLPTLGGGLALPAEVGTSDGPASEDASFAALSVPRPPATLLQDRGGYEPAGLSAANGVLRVLVKPTERADLWLTIFPGLKVEVRGGDSFRKLHRELRREGEVQTTWEEELAVTERGIRIIRVP